MSETVNHPSVGKSFFGNYYYFTRYKPLLKDSVEVGREVVGKKTDVTDTVRPIVDQEIVEFLKYVQKVYGLDLRDPEPKEEEDGEKYIYGVKEITGHTYMENLIAGWRETPTEVAS